MTICVCTTSFIIVDISRDIFSCGTRVFVYICFRPCYVFVCMVCQRCMLYDDMYLHNNRNPISNVGQTIMKTKERHVKHMSFLPQEVVLPEVGTQVLEKA